MKKNEPWLWEWLTVKEMRAAVKRTKTAILPLGVTEQHGYHLPLCTDVLNALELAKRVSAATGAVVAPESVRNKRVKDKPAVSRQLIRHPDNYQLVETLAPSPHVAQRVRQRPDMFVGVMGFPEKANAALGRRVAGKAVAGIARLIRTIETKKYRRYKTVPVRRGKLIIA